MAYSIDKATLIAQQLAKFTTSYAHHLVGQFSNFDFWLEETTQALEVLDDYSRRFTAMCDAQREWVQAHGTVVSGYCAICRGKCEFDPRTPAPPARIASQELDGARRQLKDAAYGFILRCHRAGLLDEPGVRAACERVSASLDPADLKP